MKIIPIFVNEESKEGLYAAQYDGEPENEFRKCVGQWTDRAYVQWYLTKWADYLQEPFFQSCSIENLEIKVQMEARELIGLFQKFEQDFFENNAKLQEIFRPLIDGEYMIPLHQKTKATIYNWKFRKALLRLYAIKIGPNTYVITGGAIKLVKKMADHPDTANELKKLNFTKNYLACIGLYSEDDLNFVL